MKTARILNIVMALVVVLGIAATSGWKANASSHREAPMISQDPEADNLDLYAFVSPDKPDTVSLIATFSERPIFATGRFPFAQPGLT